MANEVDFDALARKANESGGAKDSLNNLFGAAYALPKWYFIARGEIPNVNPYIASRADYMDGQQMIRAFTDTKRLARFAKENNLTDTDGSTQTLEMPTNETIDYLEQFIKHGIGGIWFNSDTESDGFSIPLKQLRPIKEHLTNINWKSIDEPTNPDLPHNSGFVQPANSDKSGEPKTTMEIVAIIVNDGLMLPSGFYKAATYACNFYCLVPRTWTEDGKMKEVFLEKFYRKFYGVTWRTGNTDGSRYVVDHAFTMVLTAEEIQDVDWTTRQNDEKNHYWFYVVAANGEIASVKPAEFQQEFNASRQSFAPPSPKSNLENFGLSKSPDGSVDLNIKIFKTGNVKFGTPLVEFYTAIVLLLQSYQGSGEFEKIFNFAPEAMRDLKESFGSNAHGNYFRLRTFQYHPPNAVADAMTIDSNQLRHVQTGASLRVSFALLQIPVTSSASLYFGFEGGRGEVEKLLNAIAPLLEAAEFVADQTENNSSAQTAVNKKSASDYVNWFRRGKIKPDTSFKPFFKLLAPLLENYAGSGEFTFTFATGMDEPNMKDLFEDVTSNSHGAYLKYRSYVFQRSADEPTYDMQVLGSNRLTNIQTGEKLLVQMTIHKKLENQETTMIVLFLGSEAEVEKLGNAVRPALDDCEFKVQLESKRPPSADNLKEISG